MKKLWPIAVVALIGFIVLLQSMYVVSEWEQVIVTQFGKPVGEPITEAGLKFKTPFVQEVHRFDKRLLRWDGERHQTITSDRKTVLVDVTARWRIADATRFLMSVQTVDRAHRRLDGIMESAVKNTIAEYRLYQVVRSTNRIHDTDVSFAPEDVVEEAKDAAEEESMRFLGKQVRELEKNEAGAYTMGRPVVVHRILENARAVLASESTRFGIEIDDVMIKTFNYTGEVEQQVFLQMNEELKKISARFRAQGQRRAEERRGQMARELETIQSTAQKRAEQIRGEADARATSVYASAYSEDPDFYSFLRTLEAQKTAMGKNHTLMIASDSPFYELLSDRRALQGRR